MLNLFKSTFAFFLSITFLVACSSVSNVSEISGTFADAINMQVALNKYVVSNNLVPVDKTQTNAKGEFTFTFENGIEAGIYYFTIGAQQGVLVLDGTEKKVALKGNMADLGNMSYTVEGSPSTEELLTAINGIRSGNADANKVVNLINGFNNPLNGIQFSVMTLRGNAAFMDTYKSIAQKVNEKFPQSEYATAWSSFVQQTEAQMAQQRAAELIQVGMEAPEITLPNPKGKNMSLSDLRGKIVLIDFWAAWCGPCRKANPKVVQVYNKYKDQGFTVFSVSLDGVDERTKSRFGGDENSIKTALESEKNKWINAIAQDQLAWDYHVSDLQKWDSSAARLYGIRSIPKTFLVDREGKIAVIDPRHDLEEQVARLINL